MEKTAKQIAGLVVDQGPSEKYGVGRPCVEAKCSFVHVFVRVVGVTTQRYRLTVPPETLVGDIGGLLSVHHGDARQENWKDENDFKLVSTERPVSDFSNKCALNLTLSYELLRAAEKKASGWIPTWGSADETGSNL